VWYVNKVDFVDPELGKKLNWGDENASFDFDYVEGPVLASRLASLQEMPVAVLSEGWVHRYTWRLAFVCSKREIPMILPSDRVQNPSEPWIRRRARKTVRVLTRPVFKGHMTTGTMGKCALLADGVPHDRIALSLYPIDVELFQRRLASQRSLSHELRMRWPSGAKVVIAVAKHVERESPLLLIETFALLQLKVPEAKLLFVGDGPLRPAIEARITALGLNEDVFLAGYVPYPKLPAYYGAADVFTHVAGDEPWGISVSEAMACGLPAVTTSTVGSAVDLIVPGVTGAIADSPAPEIISQKLAEALDLAARPETRDAVLRQVSKIDVDQAAARIEVLVESVRRSR
jgi:glycosyltransferase involved in cell wall biosynthesis